MLGHEAVREALQTLDHAGRLQVHQRVEMRKNVAVWLRADLGVQPRALQFVHRTQQDGLRPTHPCVVLCGHGERVGDCPHENRLGLAEPPLGLRPAGAQKDLRVPPDHRDDAFQLALLRKLGELQQMFERRAHVPATFVLSPIVLGHESGVSGGVRSLGQHEGETTDSLGLQGLANLAQEARGLRDQILELHVCAMEADALAAECLGRHHHLHGVHRLARELEGNFLGEDCLNIRERRHNPADTAPLGHVALSGNARELERILDDLPRRAAVGHVHGKAGEAPVYPQDQRLRGILPNNGGLIAKQVC
mmetsp:Transcript_91066/g.278757  ORF Transcript_91066/g.278757 Transcript_91066/m.278757 type:complete len:307 (+) Transcript_91066:977-1897(+)